MLYAMLVFLVVVSLVFWEEQKERKEVYKQNLLDQFFLQLRYYDSLQVHGSSEITINAINQRLSLLGEELSKFYPGFKAPKLL
jgi:hypothetical protein